MGRQRDESMSSISDHSTSKDTDSPEHSYTSDRSGSTLVATSGLTIINPTPPGTAGYREAITQATASTGQLMLVDSMRDGEVGHPARIANVGTLDSLYRTTSKTAMDRTTSRSGSGSGVGTRSSSSTSASSMPSFNQSALDPSRRSNRALPPLTSISGGIPMAQRFYDGPRPIHPPINTQSTLKHGYVKPTSPTSTGTRSDAPSSSGQSVPFDKILSPLLTLTFPGIPSPKDHRFSRSDSHDAIQPLTPSSHGYDVQMTGTDESSSTSSAPSDPISVLIDASKTIAAQNASQRNGRK